MKRGVLQCVALSLCLILLQQASVAGGSERHDGARSRLVPVAPKEVDRETASALDRRYATLGAEQRDSTVRERKYITIDPRSVIARAETILTNEKKGGPEAINHDSVRSLMVLTRANGEQVYLILDREFDLNGRYSYLRSSLDSLSAAYRCHLRGAAGHAVFLFVYSDRVITGGTIRIPGTRRSLSIGKIPNADEHVLVERTIQKIRR